MIGIFSKTIDSNLIEAAGLAGLDFVILDQEHGPADLSVLHNHIRACMCSSTRSIIRVSHNSAELISAALDTGADGVQVPNISTAVQAKEAVEATRFHPLGKRGVCRFVKAAEFGKTDKTAYFTEANQKTVVLQVEGKDGIDNLDDILLVEGFDILFIGPYDLSQSLGYPGEIFHPTVLGAIEQIIRKCELHNKKVGTFVDTIDQLKEYQKRGIYYLAYSVDLHIFQMACKQIINQSGA